MFRYYLEAAKSKISNDQIIDIAKDLKKQYPQADFTHGDCGVLALLLSKKFGGSISLVITDDEPDRALHVLFFKDFNYYDHTGMVFSDDVIRNYEDNYSEDSIQIVDGYSSADKKYILQMTEPKLSKKQIDELLSDNT